MRIDLKELESHSKFLKNQKLHELKKMGHNTEELLQEKLEEGTRQYQIEIVNETNTNKGQGGLTRTSLNYKKAKKEMLRTASIQASETCHVLSVERENFKNILMVLMQDELEIKI